ncbi:unnamed protein product [Rodentolepis nana]|uniref:Calcium-activated potassium channel subunit alpha-1 n=1 Tax=Rodentolepis nana TaxID=102285 RepID=A0A158QGR0_RODNA|nr:unnamed protein product [Rodentolepis nana]
MGMTIINCLSSQFFINFFTDLGFLRALNIFNFGEVFNYLGILSSNNVIETVDVFFTMFAMWMLASGLIHLIIHLGDFWMEDHKADTWSYLICCYFLLVTMSTVGYGDFHPKTTIGRLYICIFIPVAINGEEITGNGDQCRTGSSLKEHVTVGDLWLWDDVSMQGIFAVFVPEILNKVSTRNEQSDSYQALAGHQHVVVCGHFDNISLSAVLRGFFHNEHSSRRNLVNMVILRVSPIDLALRAILTKYNAWVKYFQGTPADPQDLARICFRSSAGAMVLATPNSSRSSDEDGANIMQAIALKAHSERIRVLVQLHHFRNKCLLENFPRWTCRSKDMVICMDELKLGLMALNCLAPGFSTIILNLLNGHRLKNVGSQEKWRREYEFGVSMEIYDVSLSYEFHNLCAQELTLFAYEKWNVVICALYCAEPEKPSIIINPAGYRDLKIDSLTTKAIVIATNSTIVNKMRNYCTKCRAHETGEICQCPARLQFFIQAAGIKREKELTISEGSANQMHEDAEEESISEPFTPDPPRTPEEIESDPELVAVAGLNRAESETFRSLNAKVKGASRFNSHHNSTTILPTRSANLVRGGLRQSMVTNFNECYTVPHKSYAPKHFDSTGCFHWVPDTPIERVRLTPADAIRYQFRDHYLLCIVGPLEDGSLNLKSFVYPLRFHWMEVRDIVILGDTSVVKEEEWVKVKNIPHVFLVQGNPCSLNDLNAVRLKKCSACTILGESASIYDGDHCMRDKNTLLCAMTIRSLIEQSPLNIHMTVELHDEQNAHHFSSAESHQLDFKLSTRFQEAFARGIIFSNTLLYSSISSLYFSGAVFRFLRVLLFGTAVEELETTNLLRNGLQKGNPNTTPKATGNRIALLKMNEVPFGTLFTRSIKRTLRYKAVFVHALMCWRILCLGIYRLDRRGFRVVVTNPHTNLKICLDDQIFCFVPSECTALAEDTLSVFSSPTIDSFSFFSNTPGATYGGMSAAELARQSVVMFRNLQQLG